MSTQYIFTTYKLSRRYPPDREVLSDISLSFLPGAKIGVIGYNGAGKSTLLRIMAGQDTEFGGQAQLGHGRNRGPARAGAQLDETKTVRENIEEGVAETKALLDRFNELSMNYSDETADEFARVQEQIDAVDGWNLDTTLEIAMDALRTPPRDADVSTLSGGERRRVALCRLLLAPARSAAARRAHQPPRRRVGRVARAPPPGLPRHGRRDHARPLLPRQRRGLDPRARPWPRHPLPGQLLGLAGAEARPPATRIQAGERPPADDRAGARVGPPQRERPA